MVPPGQTVSSKKLGYEPDPSTGFVRVSVISKVFRKESEGSKLELEASKITDAPPPVQVSIEKLPKEEQELRKKVLEAIDPSVSPTYHRAVQDLLKGKPVDEFSVPVPIEGADRYHEAALNKLNESLKKPTGEKVPTSPGEGTIQPADVSEFEEEIVPGADPLLIIPKEVLNPEVSKPKKEIPKPQDSLLKKTVSETVQEKPRKPSGQTRPEVERKPPVTSPKKEMVRYPRKI